MKEAEPLKDAIARVHGTQQAYADHIEKHRQEVYRAVKRGDVVIDSYIYIKSKRRFKG